MNMQYLHCLTPFFIGEEEVSRGCLFIEEAARGTCAISLAEEA
jgi:hypothetical protein